MTDKENNNLQARVYHFDGFALDTRRRELYREENEIRLEPRVYDLLVYLLEHRDRAVDKDELQDAVWPGMIVTETALTRAVMKARKAVGDDAATQSVIKTLHGHGYRFIAEVRAGAPTEDGGAGAADRAPSAGPTPVSEPGPAPTAGPVGAPRRRTTLALGTLAVLFVALAAWWLARPPTVDPGTLRLAVLPVADRSGDADLAWVRLGLMSLISGELEGEGAIQTVADGDVIHLVDSQDWDGDAATLAGSELLSKLRDVYGVSHALAVELEDSGGGVRMNYALVGTDGRSQRGTMVGSEPAALARGVVQGVYGTLLGRSRLAAHTELVSADPFNNEAYARGLALSREGRCEDAVPFYRVVLEQEPSLVAARLELGACLRILGEREAAETLLTGLVDELAPLGPSTALARALLTLGVVQNRSGRLDEADATEQRALEVALSVEDHELAARVLQNLAIVAEDRNDWQGSAALLDRARLEYQRAGREVMPGNIYSHEANLAMDQGRLAEADALLTQAVESFRAAGDRRSEAMMLNNTGYLRRLQGRIDEAEAYHLASLEIREAIGDRVGVGRIHGMLSVVYKARGLNGQAAEAATRAIEVARETDDRLFEGTALAQRADARSALGDGDGARGDLEASRAVFEAIDDHMRALQVDVRLAGLNLEEGRYDAAEETARRVVEDARARDLVQPEVEGMELLGDSALARGLPAKAISGYADALERVRQTGLASKENTLTRKLATLYLDAGDYADAEPLIGALSRHEPNPASLRVQARHAFLTGDRGAAVALMTEARQLAGDAWPLEADAELAAYRAEP